MPYLKASGQGLARIQQVRNEKGWTVDDCKWLVEASKVLEPNRDWPLEGPFASGISDGTWKAFLYNTRTKGISTEAFQAYCKVLGLNWEEIKEDSPPSDRKKPIETETQSCRGSEVSDRTLALVEEYTQLFVGREDVLSELDKFLTQTDKRYLTITAPPGLGKTALLANWVKSRQGNDYFIACHFFRQRDEITFSISNAYRNLLEQLYNYCEVSKSLPYDENQLREELYQVVKAWKGKFLVIVIDGLDEAESLFLPHFPTPLPTNIFIIASARKFEEEEQNYLSGWTNNEKPICLSHLTKEAIADWLRKTGNSELVSLAQDETFVAQVCDRTEGIPLFLKYLIDELVEVAQQDEESAIRKTLEATPKGFPEYINHQYQALDRLEDWRSRPDLRRIFYFLTIAKGELSSYDLVELMEESPVGLPWRVSRWFKIRQLEDCLAYSFAHSTLAEQFALLPEIKANTKKSQKELIKYCAQWEEYQSLYALRYYPEHLSQTEKWDELSELARNKTFADTQQKHLPDEPNLSLKTVQTALLGAAETDNAAGMAEFMLVHARRLVQTTEQDSPLEALRKGSLERAWKLADLYEIERCVLWYLLLAWELKDAGRLAESRETLKRLHQKELPRFSIHPAIDWQSEYAAYLLAHIFEVSEDTCTALEQKLLENLYRNILCGYLSERGNFAAAIKTVSGIRSKLEQMLALINIAKKQVQTGDGEVAASFANVLEITHKLLPNSGVEFLIGKIAKTQIELGYKEAARVTLTASVETADKIEKKCRRVNAMVALANLQVEVGMVSEALDSIKKIEKRLEVEDCYCLKNLAELQTKLGQNEKGRVTFAKAKKIAHEIEDENRRVNATQAIARAQAEAKEFTDAIDTAEEIESQWDKDRALEDIVSVQINAKDFPAALETANRIEEPITKSQALSRIANAQASSGEFTAAIETAEAIEIASEKTNTLVVIANEQAYAGDVTAALNIAEKIEDKFQRIDILVAIVKGQAKAKNFTAAFKMVEEIDNQWEQTADVVGVMKLSVIRGEVSLGKTADEIKNQKQGEALVAVVESLLEIEDFTTAITTKNKIKDKNQQQEAVSAIAKAYANAQNFTAALEMAKEIDIPPTRAKTLAAIAEAQVADGKNEAARTTFATVLQAEKEPEISISFLMSSALIQVAEFQVKNAQKKLGAATASIAYEITQNIDNTAEKANVLAIIARILVEAEKIEEAKPICDRALEIAQQISNNLEHHRSQSFILIAQAQVMIGDFDDGLRTLQNIRIPSFQADALKTIAHWQMGKDLSQIERCKIVLGKAHEFYQNADDTFFFLLSDRVDVLATIAVARSTVGETEAALATLAQLLEAAQAQERHKRNNRNDHLFTIAAAYAEVGELVTAINITDEIEDGWLQLRAWWRIAWEQFKKGEKESLLKTFDAALQAKDKIEDEKKRPEALRAIAQIQAMAGYGEQTVKTVEAILTNRDRYLPKVAVFFVETGDRQNFKKLLIPCAYYLDSAYEMCGYLARLYPEKAEAVVKVLSELNSGSGSLRSPFHPPHRLKSRRRKRSFPSA